MRDARLVQRRHLTPDRVEHVVGDGVGLEVVELDPRRHVDDEHGERTDLPGHHDARGVDPGITREQREVGLVLDL